MSETKPFTPAEVREMEDDPDWVEAVRQSSVEDQVKPPRLSVEALLAGIQFLHDFVKDQAQVDAAIKAGFVEFCARR